MSVKPKPSNPRVRRGHRLSDGLHWCIPFSDGAGISMPDVGPYEWHLSDVSGVNERRVPSPYGWAVDHSDLYRIARSNDFKFTPAANSGMTFTLLYNPLVIGPSVRRLYNGTGATANGFTDALGATGEARFGIRIGGTFSTVFGAVQTANQWTICTGTWDGVNQRIYQDGKLTGSIVPGIGTDINTYNGISISTQGTATTTANKAPQEVALAVVHSRALQETDIAELHADPFCFLRPRQRSYFFISGTPTVSASFWAKRQSNQLSTVGVIG
jgi:hypothetical protein